MTCGRKSVYVHDGEERVSKWEIVEREMSATLPKRKMSVSGKRSGVMSGSRTNLFWIGSFWWTRWVWLKLLNQFTARAAQIYKLLNQISLSDAWQSLRLKMSQNSGVSDPVMNELIQRFSPSISLWTEETVRLGLKTMSMVWACVNTWMKGPNESYGFSSFM